MEDSGIDSEDKLSTSFDDISENISKAHHSSLTINSEHMDDYDVIFRDTRPQKSAKHQPNPKSSSAKCYPAPEEPVDGNEIICRNQPANTCRILQRKLELKVERAKRNYSHYQEDTGRKSQAANLIPINCLSIPENAEKKPLVDYNSDNSDDAEEISFFTSDLKSSRKLRQPELSDTFSIQEMTIESDQDSDDSGVQNLELLPPLDKTNLFDKLISCLYCKRLSS